MAPLGPTRFAVAVTSTKDEQLTLAHTWKVRWLPTIGGTATTPGLRPRSAKLMAPGLSASIRSRLRRKAWNARDDFGWNAGSIGLRPGGRFTAATAAAGVADAPRSS